MAPRTRCGDPGTQSTQAPRRIALLSGANSAVLGGEVAEPAPQEGLTALPRPTNFRELLWENVIPSVRGKYLNVNIGGGLNAFSYTSKLSRFARIFAPRGAPAHAVVIPPRLPAPAVPARTPARTPSPKHSTKSLRACRCASGFATKSGRGTRAAPAGWSTTGTRRCIR